MSTYQQSPGAAPGRDGAGVPAGHPALQQTAAPHLHPGEALAGVFPVRLDPLLPLYFSREIATHEIAWAPARVAVRALRRFWRGLWTYFLPRWLVEIFIPDLMYRRPYGLRLERRLYRALRRPLHGGSWSGGRESLAGRLWTAVRTTPGEKFRADHDLFTLLLTDRRLLVLSRKWTFERHEAYQAVPLFELPVGSFALRGKVPGSWFTFRADLAFSDGSWIALDLDREDNAQQFTATMARYSAWS
ncbi:hypothetical protein [Kitasatospora sp. MBT63]|uniref:hypothetical protein n=1 Tax=Kitasatospora sp. MBT63 TaxID=1444768 RepID=UPI00053A271D|nr:hypothetical protein [Kitasatospora sp. MBT63]